MQGGSTTPLASACPVRCTSESDMDGLEHHAPILEDVALFLEKLLLPSLRWL